MELHVKNMVCDRCIMAVRDILQRLELRHGEIHLGVVELVEEVDEGKMEALEEALKAVGFELIDDRRRRLVERIKNTVVELIHHRPGQPRHNLSEILGDRLNYDYSYLSKLFSEVEGTTIEKYAIAQRVERVKELLAYGELSLNEIAFRLGYSSVAYLSNQFKKVTGMTPGQFREERAGKRVPLDKI